MILWNSGTMDEGDRKVVKKLDKRTKKADTVESVR